MEFSLSMNQLDYLKQEQNGFYDDNNYIYHITTSFLGKLLLSVLGVLALWRSMALWCSDSLNYLGNLRMQLFYLFYANN